MVSLQLSLIILLAVAFAAASVIDYEGERVKRDLVCSGAIMKKNVGNAASCCKKLIGPFFTNDPSVKECQYKMEEWKRTQKDKADKDKLEKEKLEKEKLEKEKLEKEKLEKEKKDKAAKDKTSTASSSSDTPASMAMAVTYANIVYVNGANSGTRTVQYNPLNVFSQFMLQNFVNTKFVFDFKAPATVAAFGPAAQMAECVFNNSKLIDDKGNLDYNTVADTLAKTVRPEWQAATKSAVKGCQSSVDGASSTTITMGEATSVNTRPLLLVQCARAALLANCPSSQEIKSDSCMNTMATLRMCRQRTPSLFRLG